MLGGQHAALIGYKYVDGSFVAQAAEGVQRATERRACAALAFDTWSFGSP